MGAKGGDWGWRLGVGTKERGWERGMRLITGAGDGGWS